MGEFRMPTLGADMEAGRLVEWRVRPGDPVERGQVVAVVETEKGAIEVEVWERGVVERLVVEPGTKVPVGTVLAVVRGEGGEEAGVAAQASGPAPSPPPVAVPRFAPEGPAVQAARHRPRASPVARKRAAELGVDLDAVTGTGPSGAIRLEDVERFRAGAPAEEAAASPAAVTGAPAAPAVAAPGAPAGWTPERLAAMRRAIAAAMARSKREIPHYYLRTELELTRAMAWLEAENRRRPLARRILPVALLLAATARAAKTVPETNGHLVDGTFRPSERVHLGVAIALRGGGLVAPAIHDADRLAPGELMEALDDLVGRVRAGNVRSSELADPTLTVTSLGDLGVDEVLGVIHPPQVAIVGFGRVGPRPRCVEGGVVARPGVVATLAGDHRVGDGIRGARLLAAIDRLLQAPEGS